MKRPFGEMAGRLLLLAAPALVFSSCASAPVQPDSPAVNESASASLEWERTTREMADESMEEAQRLAAEGLRDEALAMTDEALCAVLETPPGYQPGPKYVEFLAEIIDEADEIEASLVSIDNAFDPVDDMVILPPIDIVADVTVAEEEIIEENGLPVSDFPLVLNPTVDKFLAAMSSSGEYHRRISTGLSRAGIYLPMIRSKFSAAGLPVDLGYLPLIESAFSLKAYSRARAHGMWQFISSTGRFYGLEVGSLVDERRDPVLSTQAAVAYLGDLYQEFNDWYLALAAYNSGSGNVRRAIRRSGSRDFWVLQRNLPRETRSYVPAFIASVIVAKNPQKYGFLAPVDKPWVFDSIDVPDALDLQFMASESGIPLEELRELNPAIRRDLTPARGTTALRLPAGKAAAAQAVLDSNPRSDWAPRMIHTVRSGDSLYTIARRYGSSVSAISQANGLRGSLIRPGQNLIVPRFGTESRVTGSRQLTAANDGSYTVQRNDTLWDIARGFSVSLESLCDANGLSRRDVIRPGQRLRIPDGGTAPAPTKSGSTRYASTYTVRSGDTLSDIAKEHGISTSALKRANGLSSSRIYPGKVLSVPESVSATKAAPSRTADGPNTYRVRKGDTLYDIASRFGVSISALRRANGLSGSRIYPGDVLRIPAKNAKG